MNGERLCSLQPAGLFICDIVQASDVTPICATPKGNGILILSRSAAVDLHSQGKKKKSFRKLSVCLWKFDRVCALPIYSPFFSSVLSARNLLRNVPTSPALCTSQGISPTFLFTHYCFFLQTSASRLDFCFTSPGNLMSSVMFLNKYIRLKAYWCMMSLADTKVPVLLREQKLSKIRNVKLSLPVGEVARNKKSWHLFD